jgi:hypothetical protein
MLWGLGQQLLFGTCAQCLHFADSSAWQTGGCRYSVRLRYRACMLKQLLCADGCACRCVSV